MTSALDINGWWDDAYGGTYDIASSVNYGIRFMTSLPTATMICTSSPRMIRTIPTIQICGVALIGLWMPTMMCTSVKQHMMLQRNPTP